MTGPDAQLSSGFGFGLYSNVLWEPSRRTTRLPAPS